MCGVLPSFPAEFLPPAWVTGCHIPKSRALARVQVFHVQLRRPASHMLSAKQDCTKIRAGLKNINVLLMLSGGGGGGVLSPWKTMIGQNSFSIGWTQTM